MTPTPKKNRGNRAPRTPNQMAALRRGWASRPEGNIRRREAGLAFARRYRAEQPFRALLDSIYGVPTCAATDAYPFRGHRSCAEWLEAA